MLRSLIARRSVAVTATLILASGLATSACSDEDGAPSVTQNIEDAGEDAANKIEEGAEEVEKGAEDAANEVKKGAEDVKQDP